MALAYGRQVLAGLGVPVRRHQEVEGVLAHAVDIRKDFVQVDCEYEVEGKLAEEQPENCAHRHRCQSITGSYYWVILHDSP